MEQTVFVHCIIISCLAVARQYEQSQTTWIIVIRIHRTSRIRIIQYIMRRTGHLQKKNTHYTTLTHKIRIYIYTQTRWRRSVAFVVKI